LRGSPCYASAMPIFKGSTINMRCSYPGCGEFGMERHHITYDPPVTSNLCEKHHEDITIINGLQARKYRRPLNSKWRWFIWH
jgi:hypothetical protein